jgi:nitroimidazol reductase NimA-like FMN-containing flavoprotein (pyridoxamine 5'-phosphate oxidase superfamily)
MSEKMDFRAMRRFKQQLSQDECESILTKVYRGFLSVNGEMGYPYTIPMNFVYDNGHIYFHSALQGHKIDAVKSSPNACFTVIDEPVKEENDWWFHVKSVICFGKVSIIEDKDERTARLRQLGQKYFPDGYDLNADLMKNGPHVAVLDFKIEHITGKKVKEN